MAEVAEEDEDDELEDEELASESLSESESEGMLLDWEFVCV